MVQMSFHNIMDYINLKLKNRDLSQSLFFIYFIENVIIYIKRKIGIKMIFIIGDTYGNIDITSLFLFIKIS